MKTTKKELALHSTQKLIDHANKLADQIAKGKMVALMASRTNTFLSIPMIMCMVGYGHGLPF